MKGEKLKKQQERKNSKKKMSKLSNELERRDNI